MSQNPQQISQGIQNKIQQIVQNLGTNTGFINQVKQNLVEIRAKLDRVVQARASIQQKEAENKQQMDNFNAQISTAKQALAASQAKVTETNQNLATLQRQLQAEQVGKQALQQQMQKLSQERDQALNQTNANGQRVQQLEQQLQQTQQNGQQMQQMIGSLDAQIENIKRVVDTQRALLDPNNAGEDANLFNHIRGINTILDNILNQGPALPPPPFRPGTPGPLQQGLTIPQYGLQRGPILNPQEQATYNRMMQSDLTRQTQGRGGKMRKSRRSKKSTKKSKGKAKGKSRKSRR
jgi:hypothetical protein